MSDHQSDRYRNNYRQSPAFQYTAYGCCDVRPQCTVAYQFLIAAQVSAGLGRKISSYCKDPSPQNRKTISQETIPVLITFKGRSQLPVFLYLLSVMPWLSASFLDIIHTGYIQSFVCQCCCCLIIKDIHLIDDYPYFVAAL